MRAIDFLLGAAVRRVTNPERIFLTFDDGPDPITTPAVLEVLAAHGALATFFVVADKAAGHRELIADIRRRGHAIGNHSLDHRYGAFFRGHAAMRRWVETSEQLLRDEGIESVGFRPPAGVRTPELAEVLRELEIPLLLWRRRCFDASWGWSVRRARRLAAETQAGDLVLLHDVHPPARRAEFLQALSAYLAQLRWPSSALSREILREAHPHHD